MRRWRKSPSPLLRSFSASSCSLCLRLFGWVSRKEFDTNALGEVSHTALVGLVVVVRHPVGFVPQV